MRKHKKHLDLLEKIAIDVCPVANSRHSAALVYKNQIISIGVNRSKTHPFQKRFQKNKDAIYLHAEVDAIKNALRNIDLDILSKCTLYCCRVKHDDNNKLVWGISKPCKGCMEAISTFNISKVYFTDEGNRINYL